MVQTTPTEATQALSSFWPKVTEEVKTLNNVYSNCNITEFMFAYHCYYFQIE